VSGTTEPADQGADRPRVRARRGPIARRTRLVPKPGRPDGILREDRWGVRRGQTRGCERRGDGEL